MPPRVSALGRNPAGAIKETWMTLVVPRFLDLLSLAFLTKDYKTNTAMKM